MTPRVKPPHTLVSVLHWLWYCRATALSALANLTLLSGKNTLPFPAFGNLNFVSPPHGRAYTSMPKSCTSIRFTHQDFFEKIKILYKIFVQDFVPIRIALRPCLNVLIKSVHKICRQNLLKIKLCDWPKKIDTTSWQVLNTTESVGWTNSNELFWHLFFSVGELRGGGIASSSFILFFYLLYWYPYIVYFVCAPASGFGAMGSTPFWGFSHPNLLIVFLNLLFFRNLYHIFLAASVGTLFGSLLYFIVIFLYHILG